MRTSILSLGMASLAATACQPPANDGDTGPNTEATTGASTGGSTDAGATDAGATDAGTTDDPTTGGDEPAITRVVYFTRIDPKGQFGADALRAVEIVDGVAGPPITILDPSDALATDQTFERPWSASFTFVKSAAQLWLVGMDDLQAHPVPLPPELDRVFSAQPSSDDSHLIVLGSPPGVDVPPEDFRYYVCPIGPAGECALQLLEPASGPETHITSVHDISGKSGRIWYSTGTIDSPATTTYQGDVAAPAAATALFSSPDGSSHFYFLAPDEGTVYVLANDNTELQAIDVRGDAPGPLVSLHPPLSGSVRRTWSSDEKQVLVWNGDGMYGSLHLLTVDGATAGPLQWIGPAEPNHIFLKSQLFTADDSGVVYISDHETPGQDQAYRADFAAPDAPPIKVSGPLGTGNGVWSITPSGDPNHILYIGQFEDDVQDGFFRARLNPAGEVHTLYAPPPDSAFYSGGHQISRDGSRVLYPASTLTHSDLFLIGFDGEVPTPAINLTAELPLGVGLHPRFGPDAAQVFISASNAEKDRIELYMIPIVPTVEAPVRITDEGELIHSHHVLGSP